MTLHTEQRLQYPTLFGIEIALLLIGFCVTLLGYMPLLVRAISGGLSFTLAASAAVWAGRMQADNVSSRHWHTDDASRIRSDESVSLDDWNRGHIDGGNSDWPFLVIFVNRVTKPHRWCITAIPEVWQDTSLRA
jgi:hypothetical protein